jgi:hypothetical protein
MLNNRYRKQTKIYRKPVVHAEENETSQQRIFCLTGFDIHQCPFCEDGKMHTLEIIPKIRSPVKFIYPQKI